MDPPPEPAFGRLPTVHLGRFRGSRKWSISAAAGRDRRSFLKASRALFQVKKRTCKGKCPPRTISGAEKSRFSAYLLSKMGRNWMCVRRPSHEGMVVLNAVSKRSYPRGKGAPPQKNGPDFEAETHWRDGFFGGHLQNRTFSTFWRHSLGPRRSGLQKRQILGRGSVGKRGLGVSNLIPSASRAV